MKKTIRKRKKIVGTKQKPRLSVYKSNKHIYAQIIDDDQSRVLLSQNDSISAAKSKTKKEIAYEVGLALAKKAKQKKITRIVFDRSGYKYHGRVRSLAEGAREGGLKF